MSKWEVIEHTDIISLEANVSVVEKKPLGKDGVHKYNVDYTGRNVNFYHRMIATHNNDHILKSNQIKH